MLQIVSVDERLREQRGAKVLLLGPSGIGKTTQLATLDPERTLFVDSEAGDLAVLGLPVPTIRIDTWSDACDLACRIGPFGLADNPSFHGCTFELQLKA